MTITFFEQEISCCFEEMTKFIYDIKRELKHLISKEKYLMFWKKDCLVKLIFS